MKYKYLKQFLIWRLRHVNDRQFIFVMSAVIGILAGLAAVVIKNSVKFIHEFLTSNFVTDNENFLYFIFPTIGILLALIFIKFILKQHVGHGIPSVLFSISRENGIMKRHNMFSSIISSTLTVGFGGSVGLEGPTVATGAAIGSNLGRLFHLNYKQIMLLLGVASAASMAAIFKSPIAAIVFATEVIMIDLTIASVIPLLIASSSAILTTFFFLGQAVLYPSEIKHGFQLADFPYYMLLGVFAGGVSVYFTKMYIFIEQRFSKIKRWGNRLMIGGIILGILIFFFPALYGEGYDAINASLHGDISFLYNNSVFYSFKDNILIVFALFLLLIFFKAVATSVTFGAGGVGGVFAPTLFLGAISGLFFVKLINYFDLGTLTESSYALVGMGGLIAGVLHGPLTAIFIIAELTGGYELFVPLMLTATISFAVAKFFSPHSVYTYQLAKRGHLITHNKDRAILSLMRIQKLIERDFLSVGSHQTLGDLVQLISDTHRNIFPVIDENNNLKGIVRMDDIRKIIFKPELYKTTLITSIMVTPEVTIEPNESVESVVQKFRDTGKFNIVVIKDGKYLGFVSRAKVLSKYRSLQKYFSDD